MDEARTQKSDAAQSVHSAQSTHSPDYRNLVHVGAFVLFAAPLGFLADPRNAIPHGRSWAIGILLFITALNMFLLPHLPSGKLIARPGEGFVTGQWLYPLALALCFALFPPFAAMGAWAAMAAGDASASFIGRRIRGPCLSWNSKKTWSGMAAFVLCALPVCMLAIYWCPSQQFLTSHKTPEWPFVWTLGILGAVGGAILESLDGPLDDNLRVPLGVALLLWLSGMFLSFSTRGLPAATHVQPEIFIHALFANLLLGVAVLAFRFADLPGTIIGVSIGVSIYFFATWRGYLLFLVFVAAGSLLSKVGLAKKTARGVAEERGGRRGVSNVVANLLVPALCCLLYPVFNGHPALLFAFSGAIAAAFADTASSEIGSLSSVQPVLITTLKPVKHGTNGAISILGLAAAFLACIVTAGVAWRAGFFEIIMQQATGLPTNVRIIAFCIIVAAGMGGTLVDSVLGATIEDRWQGVGKGTVNFACTLFGALMAGGTALLWGRVGGGF